MPSNAHSGACESSPAERAHGPPRGVEQYSASRGDLTELEASRSIAPSSLAGRAEGRQGEGKDYAREAASERGASDGAVARLAVRTSVHVFVWGAAS